VLRVVFWIVHFCGVESSALGLQVTASLRCVVLYFSTVPVDDQLFRESVDQTHRLSTRCLAWCQRQVSEFYLMRNGTRGYHEAAANQVTSSPVPYVDILDGLATFLVLAIHAIMLAWWIALHRRYE